MCKEEIALAPVGFIIVFGFLFVGSVLTEFGYTTITKIYSTSEIVIPIESAHVYSLVKLMHCKHVFSFFRIVSYFISYYLSFLRAI